MISGTTVFADEIDTKTAISDLLEKKCSRCHTAERATKMHASKESFVDIIKKMVNKGANVSQKESEDIAGFLGNPSRFLFKEQCTKCHGIDRIIKAHEKGTLTKDTLKKMQEKGAKINEKEVEALWELLGSTYFMAPSPAVIPGSR
jgi:phage FluMu protein Com